MDKHHTPDLVVAPSLPLVLPVMPRTCAAYVVACPGAPGDPWDGLEPHLTAQTPDDLLDDVRELAVTRAEIELSDARVLSPRLWEIALCGGADPALVRRARRARHHLVVRCYGRPGQPIEHWWTALAMARALRHRTRGVLIDVVVDRILPRGSGPREPGAVDSLDPVGRHALTSWTWVLFSPEPDGSGYWMTVDGLERFGLPALSLHAVPGAHVHECHHLLMGLAARLVEHQADAIGHLLDPPAFREVPRRWTISHADVLGAYPSTDPPDRLIRELTVDLFETANDGLGGQAMLELRWACP